MRFQNPSLVLAVLSIASWYSRCRANDQPGTGEVKVSGVVFATEKGSDRIKKPVSGAAVQLGNTPSGWKLTPSDTPVELKYTKGRIVPKFACVQVGQKLVVKNPDREICSLQADSRERGDFGRTPPRDLSVFTDCFPKPDDFVVLHCAVNPTARARIQVVPTPCFAQCDKDGKFTLPMRLPKGEHVLKGYFPKYGRAEKTITLRGDEGEITVDLELVPRKAEK